MVKAQDFWDYICGKLNYRFFAGIPCVGFNELYNKMSSDFMHYIPAVHEQIAVSLVNGARIAGINSAIMLEASVVNKLNLDFNIDSSLPLLILASSDKKPIFRERIYNIEFIDDFSVLDKIDKYLISKNKPAVLFVKENVIK